MTITRGAGANQDIEAATDGETPSDDALATVETKMGSSDEQSGEHKASLQRDSKDRDSTLDHMFDKSARTGSEKI